MSVAMAWLQGLQQKVSGTDYQGCSRVVQVDMPASNAVDVEFRNLTVKVSTGFRSKTSKTILNNVSGHFKSGQLTAIMGPSGAGKSTLMNALTGFATTGVTGTVRAGDSVCDFGSKQNARQAFKAYRKKSCYILQDDRLNPLFTVIELMRFAADLKLGGARGAFTEKMKSTVITEIIDTLGLNGTENTRCGNLSGGQRKRVSIAVELIDNPPVVYLDEPTTGLDSLSSVNTIEMLKSLAEMGRTIVCTIHQPSASLYSLFDQVYVLAEGMCVYTGSSDNTVPYLASVGLQCPMYHNPADYILEVANGEYGSLNETLAEAVDKQDWSKKVSEVASNNISAEKVEGFSCGRTTIVMRPPSELFKFRILLKRCLIQMFRDWTVTHLKVVLHIFIGVVMGLLFENAGVDGSKTINNLGFLLICTAFLGYTSLMPAVLRFPQEMPIIKKENFNNWYNLKTYYLAVLVTGIPIQIWYSFVYSVPSYFLSGQPPDITRFLMFVLVLSMITVLSDAIGNVIGTCVNPINGTFIGAITTCAMIVFAGFLVLLSHMNRVMRTVSYISFMRYGFEGLILALYAYGRKPMECPETKDYCHMMHPKTIISEFSFNYDNYWNDIAILFIEVIIMRIIAFWTLRRKVKKSG